MKMTWLDRVVLAMEVYKQTSRSYIVDSVNDSTLAFREIGDTNEVGNSGEFVCLSIKAVSSNTKIRQIDDLYNFEKEKENEMV